MQIQKQDLQVSSGNNFAKNNEEEHVITGSVEFVESRKQKLALQNQSS